ncbi:uncharacterized protein BDR25DRAFT_358933 [Lindgomyces ingoldianus]|uniref:Uncharacterized protein n=1 Tax=Lindgomyces ingoldianus TaxID=673940 RepID=A0ACB6QKN3_9PLEO|nr:uncharacterized protein BDR25DRAFT_358933 [Lindgomyces ingoldianus]KAF2466872.1 hypothetical protein BDR25DRAFT_358933 [Lindgomyces ingoldianus]
MCLATVGMAFGKGEILEKRLRGQVHNFRDHVSPCLVVHGTMGVVKCGCRNDEKSPFNLLKQPELSTFLTSPQIFCRLPFSLLACRNHRLSRWDSLRRKQLRGKRPGGQTETGGLKRQIFIIFMLSSAHPHWAKSYAEGEPKMAIKPISSFMLLNSRGNIAAITRSSTATPTSHTPLTPSISTVALVHCIMNITAYNSYSNYVQNIGSNFNGRKITKHHYKNRIEGHNTLPISAYFTQVRASLLQFIHHSESKGVWRVVDIGESKGCVSEGHTEMGMTIHCYLLNERLDATKFNTIMMGMVCNQY